MPKEKRRDNVVDSSHRIIERISRENTELRRTIGDIYDRVVDNERILNHFSDIEASVYECSSVREVVECVIAELEERFGVRALVFLIDPQSSEGREFRPDVEHSGFRWVEGNQLTQRMVSEENPSLSDVPLKEELLFFFPSAVMEVHSMALVPLNSSGKLLGSLNIGSHDPGRFHPELDTSLLSHLGRKVCLGIEKAWNQEMLELKAATDPLTGLFNRKHLLEVLEQEMNRRSRHGIPFSCLMIDLDGFKAVNDTHGHQVGDRLLEEFARILKEDTRSTDVCVRYGGDEFVVILSHAALPDALAAACKIAERAAKSPMEWHGGSIPLRASYGVVTCDPTCHETGADLLAEADRRLYLAKQQRDCCVYPAPEEDMPGRARKTA